MNSNQENLFEALPPIKRSKAQRIANRAGRIARATEYYGKKEKSKVYRNLADRAQERATEKIETDSPNRTHYLPSRSHIGGGSQEPIYMTQLGRHMSPEERSRYIRAQRAGYHTGGLKDLSSKNPKKQRKDAALRQMATKKVSKGSYGEWSKSKLKEAYFYILDYLLEEGYADTLDDADGIFQIMSEEWFVEILSE